MSAVTLGVEALQSKERGITFFFTVGWGDTRRCVHLMSNPQKVMIGHQDLSLAAVTRRL